MQRGCRIGINNITDGKRPGCGNDQKRPLDTLKDQGRRVSPRLRNIPDCKKPYYGSGKKPLGTPRDNDSPEKVKIGDFLQICRASMLRQFEEDENCSSGMDMGTLLSEHGEKESVDSEDDNLRCTASGSPLVDKLGIDIVQKLKEALRLDNLNCLRLAKEEKRCKNVEVSDLQIVNGSKFNISEKNEIFNPDKEFDLLPGIEVGHQFLSRAQMSLAGFHEHWLGGIDCMRTSYSKLEEYHGYTLPIAVTMLLSGQCEDDDDDDLLEVVHSGQDGNDLLFNKRQVKDQVMRLGNLALKHNVDHHVPVRVIRRQDCAHSYTGKVYKYDGLYKVVKYWADKDVSEFTVFKYHLKQLQRPKLASRDQVHTIRGKVSKILYVLPGLVCKDISNGQEDICIPATNVIDNPPVAPSGFTYTKSIKVAENVILPQTSHGCNCKGSCTNRRSCSCAEHNGSDFPYVRQDGGRLIEAKDVIFECGPSCGCGPGCINRISQHGLKYQLEVYRTKDKGWAVRSLDFIPSGAPVCEYTGVLRRTDELDNVSENDFIFEIDCWQTMNEIGGRERRMCNVSVPTSDLEVMTNDEESESVPEFCIDAGLYGNVARFINHSCEPNLFVQCVLSSHHDVRLARVVLFAADDIPAMQELTYDYGYALDSVIGSDGKVKKMACNCGTADCRKRLY